MSWATELPTTAPSKSIRCLIFASNERKLQLVEAIEVIQWVELKLWNDGEKLQSFAGKPFSLADFNLS